MNKLLRNKAAVDILIQVDLGTYFPWTLMYCSSSPNSTSFTLNLSIYLYRYIDLICMHLDTLCRELFLDSVIGRPYFVSTSSKLILYLT